MTYDIFDVNENNKETHTMFKNNAQKKQFTQQKSVPTIDAVHLIYLLWPQQKTKKAII